MLCCTCEVNRFMLHCTMQLGAAFSSSAPSGSDAVHADSGPSFQVLGRNDGGIQPLKRSLNLN